MTREERDALLGENKEMRACLQAAREALQNLENSSISTLGEGWARVVRISFGDLEFFLDVHENSLRVEEEG